MSKTKQSPITEKEKMTGNIQLIDMLNQGIPLKPKELMAISNFLIESRRAYDPAIDYSYSRAPFVDRNKLFEIEKQKILKQKAENAASEYVQNNKNKLYDLAVKKYKIKHNIREGEVLPTDAQEEIEINYLPAIINQAKSKKYTQTIEKDLLTEDELNKIADYVKEYKAISPPQKDIDKIIYNEIQTCNLPKSEFFDVSPKLLKKHLFIYDNPKDNKGNPISITSPNAYTGEDFKELSEIVNSKQYFNKRYCYKDFKTFVNDKVAPIFNFKKLYPDTSSYGAYRIGDLLFNSNSFDLNYGDVGFNAWDSYNNTTYNPYNFSFTEDNKVKSDFDESYPIGSVVYSGSGVNKYLPYQPESDTNSYPSHISVIAAQSYNPQTDTVNSLTSDYGKLRILDKPVSGYKLRGVYIPNDVTVLSPRDEFKYVTFAKYYTPETIENLKKQLKQNNMSIDDFFLKPIQSMKPNIETSLNIPLTLHPRKNNKKEY